MTSGPNHTAADADEALRRLQRDPAAVAYGDHLRRKGAIPAATPEPVMTPYDEVRAGEFEVRRAMLMRFAS